MESLLPDQITAYAPARRDNFDNCPITRHRLCRFVHEGPPINMRDLSQVFEHDAPLHIERTRSRRVEVPSGLSLPLAFAMNTLLMGAGR